MESQTPQTTGAITSRQAGHMINPPERESQVFSKLFFSTLTLSGLLMGVITYQNRSTFHQMEYGVNISTVVLLLVVPVHFLIKHYFFIWRELAIQNSIRDITRVTNAPATPPQVQDHPPTREALVFSVDLCLLLTATACGFGGAVTTINNLGLIGSALGYPTQSTSSFVTLASIWTYLGRAVAGFASDHLLAIYKIPRPFILTFVIFISTAGHLLIAFGIPNSLYLASVIVGLCFGAQWALMYAIISDIFGLQYYTTVYNFGAVASPVGVYIFNVLIAGKFYEKEALKQLGEKGLSIGDVEELSCSGASCFKAAFLIISAATLFGTIASLILAVRTTKKFYVTTHEWFGREGSGGNEVVVDIDDQNGEGAV